MDKWLDYTFKMRITGFICSWQATPAVCQHKDTGASPDKNCHRHQRVCCFRCCRMEQLTPGTTNDVLLSIQTFVQRLKKHLFISCYSPNSTCLVSTRLDTFDCRAHAFWLCRASRTAQLDSLDTTNSTGSTPRARLARLAT